MNTRSLFCAAVLSLVGMASAVRADNIESCQVAHLTPRPLPYVEGISSSPSGEAAEPTEPTQDAADDVSKPEVTKGDFELTDALEEGPATKAHAVVVVNKEKHETLVLQNHGGKIVAVLRVPNTTGKPSTPTPDGRLLVHDKRLDPEWKPPVSIDPKQHKVMGFSKDKHNPLGVAWLGLNKGFIGLHGTNDPRRIGRAVSHGCIRHKNEDIKKLYSMIPVGTPVYIVEKLAGTEIKAEDIAYLNNAGAEDKIASN